MAQLILTPLEQALAALRRCLVVDGGLQSDADHDLVEAVQSGVIQNFEVAYELSWKFMQRWLKGQNASGDVDFPRTRRDLIRLAAQYGLITDVESWFGYGDARNQTSHTYDGTTATVVHEVARRFLADGEAFLSALRELNR